MFKELINKLNVKKQHLENEQSQKENKTNIVISNKRNIFKIEINDYISIEEYIGKIKSSNESNILDLLCNCVLWNSGKQRINRGIYYVITINNYSYNFLFNDGIIKINERTKKEIDEQTKKENITQERMITFNTNTNEYSYYSAKHEQNGNTYYTKYYNKNRKFSLGSLDLTKEEAYNEMNSVICNLENIKEIEGIINIELLKEIILKDLNNDSFQKNYYKNQS